MAVRFETDAEPIPGYRLLDRLGSGGFGEVWRCEAPGGIFKAVKVIHGDLRNRETDAYRFAEQELKALKRVKQVRHPYLLALDRYDIVDGRLVIVMELADCNLWERFRECRQQGHSGIPRDELLQYMFEAAEVLDLMNDKYQLQHLDIKPQNLFLLYNHVKVADFGQVKDLEGLVASVTGGITPVYAAPETFDGFVSRFCDQYSLACVYQELLTGHRPFDGSSMQQLLMQHLQAPPNLSHSPEQDRPALARALAKVPDQRFPSITAMVKALRDGHAGTSTVPATAVQRSVPAEPTATPEAIREAPVAGSASHSGVAAFPRVRATEPPRGLSAVLETSAPIARPAPPEQRGDGPIRPGLVIGVGYSGLRVVQRLRCELQQRYGPAHRLPALRLLGLDTDQEFLDQAATTGSDQKFAPLGEENLLALKLNRPAHYFRPKSNGRTLIEDWFDSQILYRLSRSPSTMGLRQLGRLAFLDHYRLVHKKIVSELEIALTPDSLATTMNATGLALRTNRPRVYLVAGLGGGTGSGMILDLAYLVKSHLRQIGYLNADVVGLLLAPADGPVSTIAPTALANTYATLTELNHYRQPDVTYTGFYDERTGGLQDNDSPFTRTYIVPGLSYPASSTSNTPTNLSGSTRISATRRDSQVVRIGNLQRSLSPADPHQPISQAAHWLQRDLFSPFGSLRDQAQPGQPASNTINTFGTSRVTWPRADVVARTARIIAPVLLNHWINPDQNLLRSRVPRWVDEIQTRLGLTGERMATRFKQVANRVAQADVDDLIRQMTETPTTKGWLTRSPDLDKVAAAFDWLANLLGPPRTSPNRRNTAIEDALSEAAAGIAKEIAKDLAAAIPAALDNPEFRLAGTEEGIRQLMIGLEKTLHHLNSLLPKCETLAGTAFDRLANSIQQHKGVKKATLQDVSDALKEYPLNWYAVVINRQVYAVLHHVHVILSDRVADLASCRTRVEEFHRQLLREAEIPVESKPSDLLPVGCQTAEEAAQRFLQVLNDEDLMELERRVQAGIESEFGGVFEACLNSAEGPQALLRIMRQAAQDYLHERLGEVDLAGMLKQRCGSTTAMGQALQGLYEAAQPALVGKGPWSASEWTCFAVPDGPGGTPIAQQANQFLPPETTHLPSDDEVVFYREYTEVPLAALTQLGPGWASAYHVAHEVLQTSPHARIDITQWIDVDAVT